MRTDNISVKQQVYTSILNEIIQGIYDPTQVIREKQLMSHYGVSRAPIREALIELCKEGVLYSIPNYGYKITPLTRNDIESIQEYRSILECTYMQRYWYKLNSENLLELEALISEEYGEEHMEFDALTHWKKNIRFHLKLFSFYESNYAMEALRSSMTMQTRAYAQLRWEKWHSPVFIDDSGSHRALADSIKSNNITQAISVLQADIMSIFM